MTDGWQQLWDSKTSQYAPRTAARGSTKTNQSLETATETITQERVYQGRQWAEAEVKGAAGRFNF